MNKKVRVVVLGDMLYDCFVWADHLPRMGETVTGYANGFFSGGKGANQAVQAARLGAETYMIGKVGADTRGDFLIQSLKESGVNTEYVLVDPAEATGTCCVHVDRAGNNAIIVAPQANMRVRPEEMERMRPLIESADVFVSQLQINLDAIETALGISSRAGVCTVLNPAPALTVPESFFKLADYLTPNETEAEFFTGFYRKVMAREEWYHAAADRFRALGTRRLVMTLGADGALYSSEEDYTILPPYQIEALDSTAAGDSFNAAFAVCIAQGAGITSAITYANAAGALTASRMGSQPSLPTAKEISEFLDQQKQFV